MVYRTTKCPYCGFTLEYRRTSNELEFAPKYLPCPNCKNKFATNKKMWYEMNDNEKSKKDFKYLSWFSYIHILVINAFPMLFIIFIPVLLVNVFIIKLDDNLGMTIALIVYLIVLVATLPYYQKNNKKTYETWKNMTYEDFINKFYYKNK